MEVFHSSAPGSAPGSTSENGAIMYLARIDTPLGTMVAAATQKGLAMLEFEDGERPDAQLARVRRASKEDIMSGANAIIEQTEDELGRYFAGELRGFTLPLQTSGTPFQERVWAALRAIPYGTTRSYSEQARAIDAPDAVRAVARANGDNPLTIVVPCHRVIGANGKLTGYGGGLWRKEYLLGLEQGGTLPLR